MDLVHPDVNREFKHDVYGRRQTSFDTEYLCLFMLFL